MIVSDSFARFCAATVLCTMCSATLANDFDDILFSSDLGNIIGAAGACEYRLDEDAVSNLIKSRVPASNIGFADSLRADVQFAREEVDEMTGLDLRLFCESTERSAEHLGLLVQ